MTDTMRALVVEQPDVFAIEDVPVPGHHLVVADHGRERLTEALIGERLVAGFVATGVLDSIVEQVLTFGRTRKVFGRRVSQFQYLQGRITDIKMDVEQVRKALENVIGLFAFLSNYCMNMRCKCFKTAAGIKIANSNT